MLNKEMRKEFVDGSKIKNKNLGDIEVRANEGYNIGTGDAPFNSQHKGADSTPLTIADMILQAIDYNSNVLHMCTITHATGTRRLVMDASAPDAAPIVREGANINTFDSEFKKVELNAFKFAKICKFTRESVEDVNFDIVGHAARRLGVSFAKGFEQAIIAGTGVNQPQGLLQYDVTKGAHEVVAVDPIEVQLKEVVAAYYNLPYECRTRAIFLAHPNLVKALALLEDSNGRALLVPAYNGEFQSIMGKRVVETPWLDDMGTTGNVVGMFVDVEKAMIVNLRSDLFVGKLNELYAENDLVAINGIARMDSKIVYHEGISAIKLG